MIRSVEHDCVIVHESDFPFHSITEVSEPIEVLVAHSCSPQTWQIRQTPTRKQVRLLARLYVFIVKCFHCCTCHFFSLCSHSVHAVFTNHFVYITVIFIINFYLVTKIHYLFC